MKWKDDLGGTRINWRVTLKRILETYGMSDDWIQLAQDSVQFSWTQYANKTSHSIAGGKFLHQLSEYNLGQNSVPCSFIKKPGHTVSASIWHQNIIKYLFSTRLCRHILSSTGLLLVSRAYELYAFHLATRVKIDNFLKFIIQVRCVYLEAWTLTWELIL